MKNNNLSDINAVKQWSSKPELMTMSSGIQLSIIFDDDGQEGKFLAA